MPQALTMPQATVETFDAGIRELEQCPAPRYILFTSSWCPDCVRCEPAIRKYFSVAKGSLLCVDVGDRLSWKSAAHPLRADPQFMLSCIPTLVHWGSSGAGKKLSTELEKTSTADEAEKATAAFVASTS